MEIILEHSESVEEIDGCYKSRFLQQMLILAKKYGNLQLQLLIFNGK